MRNLAKIRDDLIYHVDPNDESRQFVKDPIRHQFFRYNELQIEMMKALDGKRTVEDVATYLQERFEAEVPTAAIQRFIARLEVNLLLEVSSYTIDDVKTRKEILKYLHKRNLALRVKARDGASPEGQQFEAATKELLEGDPCKAAEHLDAVLAINPNNERARQVLLAIHQAFFKTQIKGVSHAKMFHAFNPDKLLTAFDRLCGKLLFSRIGVVILVVLVLSAIGPAISIMSQPVLLEGVDAFDIVIAVIFSEVVGFHHELCHGLATKHYGGTVDDIGWMFFYGVIPANYCDTSDSYLFPSVRQKIIVQFAGPIGTLSFLAIIFHLLNVVDPSFPLWTGMAWVAIIGLVSSYSNLIPLVKFDAYYALSDYVAIINLRERSFAYLRDRLQLFVFGVPAEAAAMTPRERRAFAVYGVLALVYTVIYMFGIYLSFFLPFMVDHFGIIGIAFAVYFFANLIGRQILFNQLPKLARFVFRHRGAIFTRKRSVAFAIAVAAIVAILAAPWPLYVDGQMIVEPIERAEIRAAEAGLVAEIKVREGDRVVAGQVLAVLRNDQLVRDHSLATAELAISKSRLEMLRKGARSEDVRLASARTYSSQVRSAAASAQLDKARRLRKLEVRTDQEVQRARGRAIKAGGESMVASAQARVDVAGARVEDVAALEANQRLLQARIDEYTTRVANLQVRSTVAGIVVTRNVEERVGRSVAVGTQLLEVHDTSKWRVRIVPDRGEPLDGLSVGQKVVVAANGDSGNSIDASIEQILPSTDRETSMVIYTPPLTHEGWRSGMTGQARVYTPKRSVAYRIIVLPIVRLIDFELPNL